MYYPIYRLTNHLFRNGLVSASAKPPQVWSELKVNENEGPLNLLPDLVFLIYKCKPIFFKNFNDIAKASYISRKNK